MRNKIITVNTNKLLQEQTTGLNEAKQLMAGNLYAMSLEPTTSLITSVRAHIHQSKAIDNGKSELSIPHILHTFLHTDKAKKTAVILHSIGQLDNELLDEILGTYLKLFANDNRTTTALVKLLNKALKSDNLDMIQKIFIKLSKHDFELFAVVFGKFYHKNQQKIDKYNSSYFEPIIEWLELPKA